MGGLLVGIFIGFLPACKWTPPEGIANGTQSLQADDVLADHNDGLTKDGFKIPETLAVRGQFRHQDWIFTRAQAYPLPGLSNGVLRLSSLTAEDLSRTQDPYYCAMRWDYGTRPNTGMKFFANRRLLIITPNETVRAVVVRVVDWGPPMGSEGGIMLSQAAMSALGITTGSTVGIAFDSDNEAVTGPLILGRQ
jgi:hypothetical protein